MKYWVGGATGFLGTHLVRELRACGHEVIAVSRSGGQVDDVVVEALDVLNAEAVERSARGAQGAFLCAGKVSRDPADSELLHQLHVTGTRVVLAALRRAGVPRVVVASTSGTLAVSRDEARIDDESSGDALQFISSWPYYRSKYFGEKAALEENRDGLEVVVVNPSLLLGPGDLRQSSTEDVRRFLDKAISAVPAGGMAFVDARDAARGMRLAFERGRAGERYLLSAVNLTLSAFFGRLSRLTGIAAPLLRLPKHHGLALGIFGLYDQAIRKMGGVPPVEAAEVEMGQHFWYCSAEKAERELGFLARDPGDTLRDTIHDLVERQVVAPRELR